MDDIWVCGRCKSINRQRASTCYSCHGPREEALATSGSERRTAEAAASRSVREYLASWPLAILAGVLLAGVAALGVVLLLRQAADYPAMRDTLLVALNGGREALLGWDMGQSAGTAFLVLLRAGLILLALVSFAAWLAVATLNVPALGGGFPSRGPVRVFIYTLIPVWNLFKVPGMVQEVLYRLDPAAGGAYLVMAATIGLAGSWVVSLVGGWAITAAGIRDMLEAATREQVMDAFSRVLDQAFWLGVVTELMVAVGTVLLIVLMVRVEQRCAARNRELEAAFGPAPTPSAEPAAPGPAPAPAPAPFPGTGAAQHPGSPDPARAPSPPAPMPPPPPSPAAPPPAQPPAQPPA